MPLNGVVKPSLYMDYCPCRKPHFCAVIIFFFFFFFFCCCCCCCCFCLIFHGIHTTSSIPKSNSEGSCGLSSGGDDYLQKNDGVQETAAKQILKPRRLGGSRRVLGGLGSSPPRCGSKCGRCTPCKAVHVAVPPGTPVTMEYYPEAWRCKCGNKLYIPGPN